MASDKSEVKKKRVNLTLDDSAWESAERLAAAENRSVSNFLETLIFRADSPTQAQAESRIPRSARVPAKSRAPKTKS